MVKAQQRVQSHERQIVSGINTNKGLAGTNCTDSSFIKLFESPDRAYSFLCSHKTADGGIVIGGYGRNKAIANSVFRPVLTKFDSLGNHLWSVDFFSGLEIANIQELSDGTLIVSAGYNNPSDPGGQANNFFVAKLTATGSVIWFKTFRALLGTSSCSSLGIVYTKVAEGINGDILVTGTSWNCAYPKLLVVLKLDRDGNLQWKYGFRGYMADSFGAGIFYENNEVTVINRESHVASGGDNVIHVDFLKLNYTTGALISMKSWKSNLTYPASFHHGFVNDVSAVRLANGGYCLYGLTFGDFGSASNQPRFAVLEFSNSYDFVKGYTINSLVALNVGQTRIKVNRFGQAVYGLTVHLPGSDRDKYIGVVDNGVIVHQRKREYRNREVFHDNFALFDDGSFAYIANLATIGQSNFFLEYSLLHPSDTGSVCLGMPTDFTTAVPLQYVPYNFTWDSIYANPLIETNNAGNGTNALTYTGVQSCDQKAICDTVKIHGTSFASCDPQYNFRFTAFKNRACGSRVQWYLDPASLQSMQVTNDTTVNIRFNGPWQGWLYASIRSSCGLMKDSVLITYQPSPGIVNLGPDTTICEANTILLNARKGYVSYLWSDGSTDSTLLVSAPGTYIVEVTEACGNKSSDTVEVRPAPPIAFSLGADRDKCNDDTLHITAPAGFMNYSWGPAYNLNAQTGQSVIVRPTVDTSYFVRAEKTPGCFAYDTVKVNVSHSIPVDLGPNRSFCVGDSAVFDAGAGFARYIWSNGDTLQTSTVYTAARYSVTGITDKGCKSFDTVQVLNVWPKPVVQLNANPSLCFGESRILQAGNFLSYLWQDGNSDSFYIVRDTGVYHVSVTDNNQCKGADTVHISRLIPTPANFLPLDTAVCTYGTLTIHPVRSYTSYLWNNNAMTANLTVSAPGLYWLQVRDEHNCIGKDSILVRPKECLTGFYMPNAFTPDNNRVNDYFKPTIGGIVKQYQLWVYNRWGQLVFNTTDVFKGWDGKLNGLPQDSNVYVWICVFQLDGQPLRKERGTMVLIR